MHKNYINKTSCNLLIWQNVHQTSEFICNKSNKSMNVNEQSNYSKQYERTIWNKSKTNFFHSVPDSAMNLLSMQGILQTINRFNYD